MIFGAHVVLFPPAAGAWLRRLYFCPHSFSSSLNSPDQSLNAKQSPCRSGLPDRISVSMAAISRRHWIIHAGSF